MAKQRARRDGKGAAQQFAKGSTFTAADVRAMLTNPVYGYGLVLEPTSVAIQRVQQLEQALAQERAERATPFSLDELDKRFQRLFKELEESGACTRGVDAPPIIPKEQWLQAQNAAIERMAKGEQP